VLAILVSNKVGGRLEASIAWQASETVDLVTGKGLLVEMDELDVSIESVLLAEVLVAGREASAEEFGLCVFMRLLVLLQALGCVEAFVAVWPITNVISNIIVFGFDVVLQVALAEESLVAALLRTSKRTVVGVRALVFLETDRTRVRLGAAFEVADILVLARSGLGFGRLGRWGLGRSTRGGGRRSEGGGVVMVLVVVVLLAGCWKTRR
jgi:hypothetical protein